jgi:DNA repair protein RadD
MGAGIFSAGLGKKDYESPILFASIDSIYKRSGDFEPFDFIFVDEAHRIPFSGEGKYRTFLSGCRRFNSDLRIVGWTATPFRMAGGQLCHKDHILTHLVYEAHITDLINDGYLSKLRSKVGIAVPDTKDVKRYSNGDYITKSLAEATNQESLVYDAVSEAVRIIHGERRRSIVFYCVDIDHCTKVSRALNSFGIYAPTITSKTHHLDRDKILRDFSSGIIPAICNVNVLTEGFDAPGIDCIVLLRPTLSAGLFSQMVGRGLRICGGKADCLVLDFANCIDEHGPIDLLGGEVTVLAVCQECRETFSRALKSCPHCGWILPKQERDKIEEVERNKRMHGKTASTKSILSNEPEILKVDSIYVSRHKKPGSPDSVRVQFRSGLRMLRHWITLDHPGPAGVLAQQWWRRFISVPRGHITTVSEALSDLFVSEKLLDAIKTITVVRKGKWFEVVDYNKPTQEDIIEYNSPGALAKDELIQ